MNSHKSEPSVTEDLLRLYELALSVGKELDLSGICRNFLRILISRYNLTGASLWWRETDTDDLQPLTLLPQTTNEETLLSIIGHTENRSEHATPTIISRNGLTFAIYPFSGKGVLLMQTAHQDLFSPRMINGLRPVLGTLATAIQGRMVHAQLDQSRQSLNQQRSFLKTLIQTLPDLIWLKDPNGVYLACNPRFELFFGNTESEITGKTDYDFVDQSLADSFREHDSKAIRNSAPSVNEERITFASDGHQELLETTKTPMFDEQGELIGVLGIGHDITERRQQEEQIIRQAHYDTLTELPNRFLTMDRLSQLIKEASREQKQVAILFLDLDDFKKVNDTLGHDIGDKLLKQAALRLQQSVRSGDTVGRLGGDEFIVLVGSMNDSSDARPVAESLLKQFRDSFRIDGREMILTASIGISIYPDDGDKPFELLRKSDSAMYYSKALGRNTYSYFTDEMNRDVSRRLLLEERMHGALELGEFQVYYQPKVDLHTGTIAGVEALLRWYSPSLGEVEPNEFIPIAEQSGLIVPLGQFVITESLKIAPVLQRRLGRPISVAVNLSPRQFRDPDLLTFIKQIVQHPSLLQTTFELEITEGVLMSGQSYIQDTLFAISSLGVILAMDDFGTGYSSLSYLRNYPFNVLKIDREFVKGICTSNADRELVNAAIAMAHGLGLKVVAEGIETQEQCDLLTAQGCDYGQGYLFSRPLSAEMATQMLVAESDAV